MSKNQSPARTRFAPSPTGLLHIGSARTALYAYLLAKKTGGQFLLRLEDTDKKRYQEIAEPDFKNALTWMGIEPDEGPDQGGPHEPYHQSKRVKFYQESADRLIKSGDAFFCFCSPEKLSKTREEQIKLNKNPQYDGTCRKLSSEEANQRVESGETFVVRFNTPKEGKTTAVDLLRGEITVDNSTLDDIVLIKSDGMPVYHLAAMVDDHLMGITHVMRSSEWLPTFPIHTLIYKALGWEEPIWVHLSVLLNPEGKGKLSKRDTELAREQGYPIFVKDMDDLGYLPEAVNNWVALMGWSYDDKTEFFTLNDLVEKFSLEKLNPAPAAINFSKLDHFNGLHIRALDQSDFAKRIRPRFEEAGYDPDDQTLFEVAGAIQNRTKKLTEVVEMAGFLFQENVDISADRIVTEKFSAAQAAKATGRILEMIEEIPEITQENTEPLLRELALEMEVKAGQIFGLLREILAGQKVSPPIFDIIPIIGRDLVLKRLLDAKNLLDETR